jgi:outer membrane protein
MKFKNSIIAFAFILASLTSQGQNTRILSLQECVDIALENNLTVKRGNLTLENARIDRTQARFNQLPNLNLNANSGYNWGRSIDPTTNDFINQQIQFTGFSGSSNVVLFNGLRLANSVKQSGLNLESAELDLENAKNNVIINIATFYLNVIFNRELVQNAEFQLKSSQEQLERTKKLVKSGALPLTNELELVSQVATNDVNLINAQNNLDLALLTLKQAMLIPASENIDIVIPQIEPDDADLDFTSQEVYEEAVNFMPEIKSAKLGLESAQVGVKIAQAGALPTLSLGGSFSTNYSDAFVRAVYGDDVTYVDQTVFIDGATTPVTVSFPQVIPTFEDVPFSDQVNENLSRSLGLNLSIPVFNRFNVKNNVQRSKIQLQQAEITSQERQNTLRQQIESAYNDAQAALKTYQASDKQVKALEETFRAIENQYNLGAANFTDYQVASNNMYRAKSDFVRAKYDFIFKQKILDFYRGNTLTID